MGSYYKRGSAIHMGVTSMPDYIYVSLTAITIVGAAVILGAWLNERKLKRTRGMYRDVDVKEWL